MWWSFTACLQETPDASSVETLPDTRAYTEACEEALGSLPVLDCDDVPAVVQTAMLGDGTVLDLTPRGTASPDGTCDRPSLLSGCTGGTRLGVLLNERGSRFWLACRVVSERTPDGLYDAIAVIGRSETGDACFWGTPEDGKWRPGGLLPKLGSPDGAFWAPPADLASIACRSCHDGNGLIVTPGIVANLGAEPLEPDAPFRPLFASAFATVEPSWAGTPLWVHPDAAPCRACHELPQGPTCLLGPLATGRLVDDLQSMALRRWPTDRWMDDFDPDELAALHGSAAGWELEFGAAADRLLACCGRDREACWDEPHATTMEGP